MKITAEQLGAAADYADGLRNDQFAKESYEDAVAAGFIEPSTGRVIKVTAEHLDELVIAAIEYADGLRNDQFAKECYEDAVATGLVEPSRG